MKLPHLVTELRFTPGRPVERRLRVATSADCYAWARDQLQKARLTVEMLKALGGSEFATEREFLEEATRDGMGLLVEQLVDAAEWRERAREARRDGR